MQYTVVTAVCKATFRQRASDLQPRASQPISSLISRRREYHIPTLLDSQARLARSRCRFPLATPTTRATHLSSLSIPNARWVSYSRPRYEAAEKQSASPANEAAPPAVAVVDHQPPLPVRIALVATTTALATPAFPVLGFLYTVLRVTVPDPAMRNMMEGRWGTVTSFATWTLLPYMYNGAVASLILPCAVGNAIVAGGVYGLVDVASGGPNGSSESLNKILQTPWIAGSGIGATVGYVAPKYLYGPTAENLYAMEGMSNRVSSLMCDVPMAMEVSVVTGAIAGMILHPMLYFPMNGISGIHWGYFSGTALAAATSALIYVYYGRKEAGLPIPKGSFIEPSKMALVHSIMRYNNSSGEVETYSLTEQRFIGSSELYFEGQQIAEASRKYAKSGKAVFDDRSMAFVYNFWDEKAKTKYPEHVLNIRKKKDLQQVQNCMSISDASVAVILNSGKQYSKQNSDMMSILPTIIELNSSKKGKRYLSPTKLEEVSAAIELLMIMKQPEQDQSFNNLEVSTVEQFVRERCPGLTLYSKDENYKGESVESQLQICSWKGPELSQALHRWKHVHKEETYRTWRNRALVVTAGVLLSFAGAMLQGNR